jgi:polyisoprenoid-binding protein YceI
MLAADRASFACVHARAVEGELGHCPPEIGRFAAKASAIDRPHRGAQISESPQLGGGSGSLRYLLAILALLFGAAAGAPALQYQLDGAQSQVTAKVGARFPRMTGGIRLSPDRLEDIDLDVTLDARALVASDDTTTKQLRGPKFFDVERFPVVRFSGQRMTMIGPASARIDGNITARGVTRPTRLSVTFAQPPAKATGREPITLTASGTIDRREFGMTSYSMFVGKKVTITIKARMVPG